MNIVRFVVHGLRQAASARKLLALLWLVNALAALPLALAVMTAIGDDVGASLYDQGLRTGIDMDWLAEYAHRSQGVAALFTVPRTGKGVVYENLDGWLSGAIFTLPPAVLATGALYGLVWTFLLGAVVSRLRQPHSRVSLARFAGDGGRYFLRLVLLAAAAAAVYAAIYQLGRWLFAGLEEAARDVTAEGTVLVWSLLGSVALVALLNLARMVFDYAKIAVVADDLAAPLALWQGARFVAAHPLRTAGVYAGIGAVSLLVLALYAALAPGAGQSTALTVVLAFAAGQLFVAARLGVRLALLAAQLEVYRHHGGL